MKKFLKNKNLTPYNQKLAFFGRKLKRFLFEENDADVPSGTST